MRSRWLSAFTQRRKDLAKTPRGVGGGWRRVLLRSAICHPWPGGGAASAGGTAARHFPYSPHSPYFPYFRLAAAVCILQSAFCIPAEAQGSPTGWMIYPYSLRLPDDQFQRLLQCKEAEYIGIQVVASPTFRDEITRDRVAQLVGAGKRVVLQIWFGSGPPLSWERYNFPNLALSPPIREEFFARATDRVIDFLGPKNLYAVHLMEETGMQFGWDVDMPGRPGRDDDGWDNGSNWDNPPNWVMERCISGPNVLTIRRYNDLFRKETGLDMRLSPIWTPSETERYKRWVQERMEGGTHVEFARHVHAKYPGLRVYAFNSGPALLPQSKVLDGHFTDPYVGTAGVYIALRALRTVMRPDEDLVGMAWGNREKPAPERLPQQAACYLAGCGILSTFGDKEQESDQWLSTVRDSVKPFLGRPVFRSKPRVLVLGGGWFGPSLHTVDHWITGFAHYDVCEPWAEDVVPLAGYDLVLAWGTWHKGVLDWVRAGGALVAVHPASSFAVQEGLLGEPGKPGRLTVEYRPDAWMRERLGLSPSYALELDRAVSHEVRKADLVHQDQFLYAIAYGKGLILLLPALPYVHPPWQYEASWEPYRQLLTDLCRGALASLGKKQSAEEFFDDPRLGNDYLKATSSDGRTTVYVLLNDTHGPNPSPTSFVVPGRDAVTGQQDVRLCAEHPVVVVER